MLVVTASSLLGAVVLPRAAYAVDATIEFACLDSTTQYNAQKDTSNHSVVITCASGQQIDYLNYTNSGLTPVAVKASCPGTDVPNIYPDTPGGATSRLTIYCDTPASKEGSGGGTHTANMPGVTSTTPPSVHCADGSLPKNNDTSNCPVTVVSDSATKNGKCADVNNCDIIKEYIQPFINFLAALVGVAVVISIVIGGIQYGSSAGDPSKVTAAKNRIRNAIIALVTFLFLYTLLNFLIPGGLV